MGNFYTVCRDRSHHSAAFVTALTRMAMRWAAAWNGTSWRAVPVPRRKAACNLLYAH